MAAAYFVDSSALVKRYVVEAGTGWVRGITRHSPSTVIYIAHITAVGESSTHGLLTFELAIRGRPM